jgi:hypothetical protein
MVERAVLVAILVVVLIAAILAGCKLSSSDPPSEGSSQTTDTSFDWTNCPGPYWQCDKYDSLGDGAG